MKRKFPRTFLLFPVSLIVLFIVSCGPAELAVTDTSTPGATLELLATPSPITSDNMTLTAEMTPTLAFMLTNTTLTAEMGLTLAAIPTNTPPPWATIIPADGDLGWGSVDGTIFGGDTNLPLEGATITCEHFSDTSPYLCNGVTTTNSDGAYAFTDVFFRTTDRITLLVEAPGYTAWRFEQAFFARAGYHADLGLFPVVDGSLTPTPVPFTLMCTPPACSDGVLVCGDSSGCLGGCGTICLPFTSTPP